MSNFTVNTLLGLPTKEFCDKIVAAGEEQDEGKSLKGRVAKGMRGLQWKAIEGQVRRKAGQLLDIDVMALIASAWRQGKVTDKLEEENKTRGINVMVPLQEHSIRSEMEPHIEIEFSGFTQKIPLDVVLEITITGIVLSIEDSIIKGVEAGSIEGFGEIKIANVPIFKRGFGPFDLPGKVNLGKGIPLRRHHEAQAATGS